MESQSTEIKQKEVSFPNFSEIITQNNLGNNYNDSQQNLSKTDENKQGTIQENESMVHTPTETKENIPLIPYLDDKLNMSKVYPITYQEVKQDSTTEQNKTQESYNEKKQEIKQKLEKIKTRKDLFGHPLIDESKHDEGLSLANELLKLQEDRKQGNFTKDANLIQNEQIPDQIISSEDKQIDYDIEKWKQLIKTDIQTQQIDEQLPNLDDLRKIKNIDLVLTEDFFEKCGPIDKWRQLQDDDDKVIKQADCQKYGNIMCLYVSSYY